MAWVIGDIHGCLEELQELLFQLPSEDRLIFLGDYVDRGPDSAGVVDRLLKERNRSIFLKGNHESMMIAHFLNPASSEGSSWTYGPNGGLKTLQSYGLGVRSSWEELPFSHREFLQNLKLYFEDSAFIAVHAGLDPGVSDLSSQSVHDLLWIRLEWINREEFWKGSPVYYGHTPTQYILGPDRMGEPLYGKNSIGIDTGCVYGGSLSAINTESGQLIQVTAKKAYS